MKKKNSKKATIIASFSTDLSLAINWLILKKSIKSVGEIRNIGNGYAVTVLSRIPKKDLNIIVKDKFGVFAKVI